MNYVKLLSETVIEEVPVNYKTEDGNIIFNFNTNRELMLQYGYKPLIISEKPINKQYNIIYKENKDNIIELISFIDKNNKDARINKENYINYIKEYENNKTIQDDILIFDEWYDNELQKINYN